jgi:hypothetical protein
MRIVFVHFGKKIPEYLRLNIDRTRKLFPGYRIVLITNPDCKFKSKPGIDIFEFTPDSSADYVASKLSHPREFRNDFWFKTILRFFALRTLQDFEEEETLHIESDVILAQDFPISQFTQFGKLLSYPLVSHERGIGSIVYVKNLEIMQRYIDCVLKLVERNSNTTDMLILREFYDLNLKDIQILPTAPTNQTSFQQSIEKPILEQMENGQRIFRGVFDGSDLGIFLGGIDPRNNKGRRILGHEIQENYVVVKNLKLEYSSSRNFVSILDVKNNTHVPLYNLHIHSKDLRFFDINKSSKILKKRVDEFETLKGFNFLPSVYFRAALNAIVRRIGLQIKKVFKHD